MKEPNFFIVGVPKAGTTSLHNYLAQHPEIYMSQLKEPYYFAPDLNFSWRVKDFPQYLSLFAGATLEGRIGESSPGYIYSEVAAQKIKAFCPTAKIIVLLRNPIDMLDSLHSQLLYTAHEDILNFEKALEVQEFRARGQYIPISCDEPKILLYFEVARYSSQLRRYLKLFGHENVHVILFENFVKSTPDAYRQTLEFLEVYTKFKANFHVYNSTAKKMLPNPTVRSFLFKNPAYRTLFRKTLPAAFINWSRNIFGKLVQTKLSKDMNSELRSRLKSYFRSEVEELSYILSHDLTHWVHS